MFGTKGFDCEQKVEFFEESYEKEIFARTFSSERAMDEFMRMVN